MSVESTERTRRTRNKKKRKGRSEDELEEHYNAKQKER